MGLFSFINRKKNSDVENDIQDNQVHQQTKLPEIPENVFIEKEISKDEESESSNTSKTPEMGITLLFNFLEKNFEAKGYDDALINPDTTHLDENIRALKNELDRVIIKVITFYEDFIREINFHIREQKKKWNGRYG